MRRFVLASVLAGALLVGSAASVLASGAIDTICVDPNAVNPHAPANVVENQSVGDTASGQGLFIASIVVNGGSPVDFK